MTRTAEGVLVAVASGLAAFGVALVDFANGESLGAQVGLTFLVFLIAFGGFHAALRAWAPDATPLLLPPVSLLAAIGFIAVYRLSPYRAGLQRWWLLIAAAVACALLALLSRNGLAILRRYRNLMLLTAVILLLLPNLPSGGPLPIRGLSQNGSRLWVVFHLGFTELHFQPAEIAKILFVSFLAAYLADRQAALTGAHRRLGPIRIPEPRQLVPLLLVWAGSLLILIYQRDLGASLLLFITFAALLYAATGAAGYLFAGGAMAVAGGIAAWSMFDHVQRRVEAWLRPFEDYADTGYQVAQGLFALGTGSLSGSGPGLGRPDLIPNAATDFIFAAVGEELGLAGSVAVLCCFGLFLAAGFGVALRSRDRFRSLLAAGLTFVIGLQTFLIIGGVLRVLPLTGITLPFMSYGGSALIGNFLLLGLLARASHEERS
ncbi:MAG TPA: FtsW/RodA/SpoVE family cell cycle protein [Acidimicrobiia bacterium]|nr:FtsW/RodA/SpoVE family cell cycle protein [Acidimicrobiia bacterium]